MTLIAVILALAGAPASTPVTCSTQAVLPVGTQMAYAVTYTGKSPSIVLGGEVCQWIRSRNTLVRAAADYVVLREAVHAAGIVDECADDVAALALAPSLVSDTLKENGRAKGLTNIRWFAKQMAPEMGCAT